MAKPRLKVFLDTSALIAGIASSKGAAREVLRLSEIGLIELFVSRQVIVEANKNIEEKLPECIQDFRTYLHTLSPILLDDPSEREVRRFASMTHPDDAPILAAASAADVDYLVTWDRKHFLDRRQNLPAQPRVVSSGDFLKEFRSHIESGMRTGKKD